jgi:DNA-binding NarL/FixJ family response regulator
MTLPAENTEPMRVVLADDHQILLEGLSKVLSPHVEIVGTATDGAELVRVATSTKPDLIVTDYAMPKLNGLDAIDRIRESGLDPLVIVLTVHLDSEYATQAIERGVNGYVLKSGAATELVSAVTEVLDGGRWLSPMLAMSMLEDAPQVKGEAESRLDSLTDRQREILALLVKGKSAKEIAEELDLSPKTIEYHKYRMMGELCVATSPELIRLAVKGGLDD